MEAFLDLDEVFSKSSYLLNSGGGILLTGKGCPPQCGHNDSEVLEGEFPEYFIICSCEKGCSLLVCPVSQAFLHHDAEKKVTLTKSLDMEEAEIPPFPVSLCYGYLQHAGAR